MTDRPEDIPADVWARAYEVACGIPSRPFLFVPAGTEDIARAIMAERERCANVAENGRGEGTFGSPKGLVYLGGYCDGRVDAANDIRKGSDE